MGVSSLLQHALAWLRAPANEASFALRSTLRWRRGPVTLRGESMADLFAELAPAAAAAARRDADRLVADYDLVALSKAASRLVFAENLALLERLERLATAWPTAHPPCSPLRAIDVGCGNFAYATALHRWLRRLAGDAPVELAGIEVDGHGIYRDGHTRAEHMAAHAGLAGPGVRAVVGDFLGQDYRGLDVVTLLFPFLSVYPLLRWGLPLSRFRPRRLLRHAVGALRPGGLLVVANQTGQEAERLRALLQGLPVQLRAQVPFATALVPYAERTADRVGSLWERV